MVQTAIATAKKSEQDRFTVEQTGMADAAKAKWTQEVLKAKAVTEAEQLKAVATLDALTAEQEKKANILRGEGEASYKRAVTQANNNFEVKADKWLESQKYWADAFSKFQGNIVPQYQTGGGGSNINGATQFMELMSMSAAKQLGLDMGMGGAKK